MHDVFQNRPFDADDLTKTAQDARVLHHRQCFFLLQDLGDGKATVIFFGICGFYFVGIIDQVGFVFLPSLMLIQSLLV